MPDIKSILLLCSFLCFITGIFSPEIIIKWGIPSVKTRRRILVLFGSVTLLLIIFTQIGQSLPDAYTDIHPEEASPNIFVFSPVETGDQMKIYKIAETGYTNHLEINILSQQTSVGNENYTAPEGYEFVQLNLSITNKLQEPYTLDIRDLQLQTGMLEVLSPTLEMTTETKINLDKEETVELSLVYLQPLDQSYLTLTYLPLATSNEANEETSTEVSVSKVGEIIKTQQTMIQVHEVNHLNQSTTAGFETIEVSLSIKNPSNHTMTYYPFHFELSCSSSPNRIKSSLGITGTETLKMTELASGGMVTGTLIFEVPKGATDLKLYYQEPSLFTKQTLEINLMETSNQSLPLQPDVVFSEQWKSLEELNNHQLNILETQFLKETKYTQAKAHHQLIVIHVELTNHSSETQEYTAFDFKLMNEQGRLMMPSLLLIDNQSELTSGTLAPQESVQGYLLFEDSDLYSTFHLIYSPDNWRSSECMIQPLP